MLFGFLTFGFIILSLLLTFIIFLQKGKSSLGIGNIGGSNQMLFGGSGGQDLFQKITWVLLALFMASSLGLSIMKSRLSRGSLNNARTHLPQHQAKRS